jgi:hypothetical protein
MKMTSPLAASAYTKERSSGPWHGRSPSISPAHGHLEWDETGGPVIDVTPQARGFGSILAECSVSVKVEHDWRRKGLRLKLMVPLKRRAVKSDLPFGKLMSVSGPSPTSRSRPG